MKETTILAILFVSMVFMGILTAEVVTRGRAVAELEAEVTRLERQVVQRQVMLDDTHALYQSLEFPVYCIETEMTAREMLWHIREIAETTTCIEVH